MSNVTRSNVRRRINDALNFENYKNEEHRRSSGKGSSNATDPSVYVTKNKERERNITIIDSKHTVHSVTLFRTYIEEHPDYFDYDHKIPQYPLQ